MAQTYSIRYPRKVFVRAVVRMVGRVLIRLLARPEVTGLENLPKSGPLIVVGNHVAMIEVIMMAMYAPWQMEFVGTGDIPFDPRFAGIVNLWGVIPVNRGSTDRKQMNVPLDLLKQGGVLGIFPEGGIWSTNLKQARTGVAWLSFHSDAPVLPMGFGGMKGALGAAMALKRPRIIMNVGKLMPPVAGKVEGKSRKEALEEAAAAIMSEVEALIPAEEKLTWKPILDEQFEFALTVHSSGGDIQKPIANPAGLGRFFHVPVILDVMARNMNLPVEPLRQLDQDPSAIADAAEAALGFFDSHPQFLSYRFGYADAEAVYAGLSELRDLAREAAAQGAQITLHPVRRYRIGPDGEEVVETAPASMHQM